MAGKVRVDLTFDADNKAKTEADALDRSLKGLGKSTNSLNKKFDSAFKTIQTGAKAAAIAVAGVTAAVGVVAFKAVRAANVQEDAVKRLNTALRSSGSFSKAATKELQAFAAEMEATTKFGDELVINQLALAKSFGATNDQAKQVVKAAADLASEFGIDLESATRNVAKTLGGLAGELGETVPELKALTQEQLKAGEGINLLANRYSGAALEAVQTFSGSLEQLNNTFGSIFEALGGVITQSPAVKAGINLLNTAFKEVIKSIEENNTVLTEFVDSGVKGFIGGIKAMASIVVIFNRVFGGVRIVINSVVQGFLRMLEMLVKGASIIKFFSEDAGTALEGFAEKLKIMQEAWQEGTDESIKSQAELEEKIESFTYKLEENLKRQTKAIKEAAEERKKALSGGGPEKPGPFVGPPEPFVGPPEPFVGPLQPKPLIKQLMDLMMELIDKIPFDEIKENINKGSQQIFASAASGLAAGDFGSFAGSFANIAAGGGPMGQATQQIVQLLGQSEEQVRETVRAFAEGAVTFIENLVINIPVLIEELNRQMPRVAISLAKRMPSIAIEFSKGLVKAAPSFITALIKGIGDGLKELFQKLTGTSSSGGFLGKIPVVGGVIGGVTKAVGGIAKKFGFAEGGFVPSGFPNDTFPARLTSGEFVVNNSLSPKLERFLDEQGRNGSNKVDRILDIVSRPMTVNASLELNQQTFADIILTLNRTNARLA